MSDDAEPTMPQAAYGGLSEHMSEPPARLWTPWRMRYVAGAAREDGCIFCNRLADEDDTRTLILHRSGHAFVIMNLFPYNTGHVMIVPNAHIASPEGADEATAADLANLRRPVLAALRRALTPAGFNLGLNIGDVAGAGVSEHLHEHVVPRWLGDANFMPILASTMVMPELIPATYAKIRAELQRAAQPDEPTVNVVVSQDRQCALVDAPGHLPRVPVEEGEAVWRAARHDAQRRGARQIELLAWAGAREADKGPIALLHEASLAQPDPSKGAPATAAIAELDETDRQMVQAALARVDTTG
jgi:ATP adenylyltransferase